MIFGIIKNPNPPEETFNKTTSLFNQTVDFYGFRVGDPVILVGKQPIFEDTIGEITNIDRDYNTAWNPETKRMEQIKVLWPNGSVSTHIVAELEHVPTPFEPMGPQTENWYESY